MAGVRSSGAAWPARAAAGLQRGCCAAGLRLWHSASRARQRCFFLIRVSGSFYPLLIRGRRFPGVDAGDCSGVWVYPHRFAWEFMCCTQVAQWLWGQAHFSCCLHFSVSLYLLKHLGIYCLKIWLLVHRLVGAKRLEVLTLFAEPRPGTGAYLSRHPLSTMMSVLSTAITFLCRTFFNFLEILQRYLHVCLVVFYFP